MELYRRGERQDSREYSERLLRFIRNNFQVKETTTIYGASDGEEALKKVVEYLPRGVKVASLFHYSRSGRDNGYYLRNQEGIDVYQDLRHKSRVVGCSAESDIFNYLKRKLGTRQRIYGVQGYRNMLK